jgi:phosphate transport system substrate-binding protein
MKNNAIWLIIISFLCISCRFSKPKPVYDNIYIIEYMPFEEGTKAVKLPETSTLKLNNDLPKLDGATALYPLYSAFVQAVYPEKKYSPYGVSEDPLVGISTTSGAYKRLIDGSVDIIFCAKPSEEQIEMAKENDVKFQMTPIGREAFVFFVNKRNPVSNLTTEQIVNIYSGKIKNWSELNGKKNAIRVYQRPKNSGSQTMLLSIMGDVEIIEPLTENVLTAMEGMINETSVYRNYREALGYSFLFYTTQMVRDNNIKLLSINGIFPSIETIQNGTYPYSDTFYAITVNKENQNENVSRFIDWILSEQGQYLVKITGYVPVN